MARRSRSRKYIRTEASQARWAWGGQSRHQSGARPPNTSCANKASSDSGLSSARIARSTISSSDNSRADTCFGMVKLLHEFPVETDERVRVAGRVDGSPALFEAQLSEPLVVAKGDDQRLVLDPDERPAQDEVLQPGDAVELAMDAEDRGHSAGLPVEPLNLEQHLGGHSQQFPKLPRIVPPEPTVRAPVGEPADLEVPERPEQEIAGPRCCPGPGPAPVQEYIVDVQVHDRLHTFTSMKWRRDRRPGPLTVALTSPILISTSKVPPRRKRSGRPARE